MNRFNRNLTQLALAIAAITSAPIALALEFDAAGNLVDSVGNTIITDFGNTAAPGNPINTAGGSIAAGAITATGQVIVDNTTDVVTVTSAGTPATTPSFNGDDGTGRPTELVQNRVTTDEVIVDSTSQLYNPEKIQFSNQTSVGTTTTSEAFVAPISYDANGVAVYGANTPQASTVTNNLTVVSEDSVTLGQKNTGDQNALTLTRTDANGMQETVVNSSGVTATGDLTIGGNTSVQALSAGATGVTTLNASDLVTAGNGLNVTGDTNVQGLTAGATGVTTLNASGNVTAQQDLTVAGNTNVQALNAGTTGVSTLNASGNVTADQNLTVNGNTNVQALNAGTTGVTTLNASGLVTAGNGLNVTGSTNVQTLNSGATNVSTLNANGNLTAQQNLTVNGNTNVQALNAGATDVTTLVASDNVTAQKDLTVNGKTNLNGAVSVNAVDTAVFVEQEGKLATTPVFEGADAQGRPTTLVQNKEQVDTVTTSQTSQVYNSQKLEFSSRTEKGTQTTAERLVAAITYDDQGRAIYGTNLSSGVGTTLDTDLVSEDSIVLGKATPTASSGLTISTTDAAGNSSSSSLTANGLTTAAIVLAGKDLGGEITRIDVAAAAETKARTDADTAIRSDAAAETVRVNGELTAATTDRAAIRSEAAAETVRVNGEVTRIDAAAVTLNSKVDANDAAINTKVDAETVRVNGELAAATTDRAAIRTEFATADTALNTRVDTEVADRTAADTAIRSEAATETVRVNGELATATTDRAAIRTEFAAADTVIRSEAAAEAVRVNGEVTRIDAAAVTLDSKVDANAAAINTKVDAETVRVNGQLTAATTDRAAVRSEFAAADTVIRNSATAETVRVNSEVNRLDGRVTSLASTVDNNFRYLDGRVNQVERTANRGVAISLAAQQSVPNLSAGRTAVYGGVGYYEGESALAFGVATMLKDNRTAFSLAIGASGSNEIGGRAGVSFIFGE